MMITWTLILKVCGGIITLGGATTIIVKVIIGAINKLNEPIDEIRNKMEEMKQTDKKGMARIEEHEARLNTHNAMLDKIMEDNKVSMKALLLLLSHAETGNNTGDIAEGRKELEAYLNESRYK